MIGGGFVGAEVASTAASLGVQVTILEAAPAPVARALGARVGLMLAERWRDHGVDVRLAVGVAQVRSDASGRVASVLLTNGELLRADAVLVGVGIEPARELLPPRPAAHVVPAGDVVGPGHWTAAALDGSAAARRILGLPAPTAQPPYVWSDQFGLRLQLVGQPGPEDEPELDGGRRFVRRPLPRTRWKPHSGAAREPTRRSRDDPADPPRRHARPGRMRSAVLLALVAAAAVILAVALNLVLLGRASAQNDRVGRLAPGNRIVPAAPAWTLRPVTGPVDDRRADD